MCTNVLGQTCHHRLPQHPIQYFTERRSQYPDMSEVGRALSQAPPSPISLVQDADGKISIAGDSDSPVIDTGVQDDLDILFVLLSGCAACAIATGSECLHTSRAHHKAHSNRHGASLSVTHLVCRYIVRFCYLASVVCLSIGASWCSQRTCEHSRTRRFPQESAHSHALPQLPRHSEDHSALFFTLMCCFTWRQLTRQ